MSGLPPKVPDHKLLRRIGKGSYGEVWLARGVTGVHRAVKLVFRRDFEDERGFEREFEGIRAYEPVSRSHEGLVQVLHIGRQDEEGFYYYVMELADDVQDGVGVNEVEYEPRTLRSELDRQGRLPVADSIAIGHTLAGALEYLHGQGLTHRDIKPSNVIFVNGRAKLADIGLVARHGQRTFVGTEGFVPPEGPGAPPADIYSLGMVLYEISSGKDRLQFPELPEEISEAERPAWLQLNEVICRACEADTSSRYPEAAPMHTDLEALVERRPLPKRGRGHSRVWAAAAAGAVAAGLALWFAPWRDAGPATTVADPNAAAVAPGAADPGFFETTGSVKIVSQPEGASITHRNRIIGVTPHVEYDLPVGMESFTLSLPGFRTEAVETEIEGGRMAVIAREMAFYAPPEPGDPWRNQLGMPFEPDGRHHISAMPVRWHEFEAFLRDTGAPFEGLRRPLAIGGGDYEVVLVPERTANEFSIWLLEKGREKGFLGPEHYYAFQPSADIEPVEQDDGTQLFAFHSQVRSFVHGGLRLRTEPAGAAVYEMPGHRFLGRTPLDLPRLTPGTKTFEFRLEGHEDQRRDILVEADRTRIIDVSLRRSRGVVFSGPWENSLGIRFVPVGNVMMAVWPVRVRDWRAFEAATGFEGGSAPFRQEPNHPFAMASRNDAEAFCEWLTEFERLTGFLQDVHTYRLPTDREWSIAAGLDEPPNRAPFQLDGVIRDHFPWGREWPPPPGSGNFACRSAPPHLQPDHIIPGYDDGFAFTSPVGSFPPNERGLYDLGGNVWEWIADDYGGNPANPASFWAVCRGGSWADSRPELLRTSMRNILTPDFRGDGIYGFRVVVAREAGPLPPTPPAPEPSPLDTPSNR